MHLQVDLLQPETVASQASQSSYRARRRRPEAPLGHPPTVNIIVTYNKHWAAPDETSRRLSRAWYDSVGYHEWGPERLEAQTF